MRQLLPCMLLLLAACHGGQQHLPARKDSIPSFKMTYKKVKLLSITGDFDGDGRKDTIREHLISITDKRELDSMPDPFGKGMEYDSMVSFVYHKDVSVVLTVSGHPHDSIYIGTGFGAYCLINLGDNNHDGKDELAYSTDYADYSHLNSCDIFSYCKGKWEMLFYFDIHESAFDYTNGVTENTIFHDIPDYLVKQKGKWMYRDNSSLDSTDIWMPLQVPACK